jgi:hypothetical protein
MVAELLVAPPEKIHVVFTADETQMWHLTNEEIWRRDNALFDKKRPELLGDLECFSDFNCLRNVNRAIGSLRCVVELTYAAWPVPALLQAFELSPATVSRLSKTSIVRPGCSCLRSVPNVALIMPAPTRTTSGRVTVWFTGLVLANFKWCSAGRYRPVSVDSVNNEFALEKEFLG